MASAQFGGNLGGSFVLAMYYVESYVLFRKFELHTMVHWFLC